MQMDPRVAIAILIFVALIAIAVIVILTRKRRSQQLRERYGPEYDRAVVQRGDPARAEMELLNREKRVHSFSIKRLSPETRDRYVQEWSAIQRRFVDDPAVALAEADSLVNQVMLARGYPMADFEQRAADISVGYPGVVQNYRAARMVVQRHGSGHAGTEDLRQAMVHYRALFEELLDMNSNLSSRGVLHERAS